jgi:hypothetical protein
MEHARARVCVNGTRTIRHHVVPLHEGGTDDESNVVVLTPREHAIAHYLLVKTSTGDTRYKALCALRFFILGHEKRFGLTTKDAATFRSNYVQKYVDEALEENHRRHVGSKDSDETKAKKKKAQNNRSETWLKRSSESKMGAKNPMYGKPSFMRGKKHSAEAIACQSASIRATNLRPEVIERRSIAAKNRKYLWRGADGTLSRFTKQEAPPGLVRVKPDGREWPF